MALACIERSAQGLILGTASNGKSDRYRRLFAAEKTLKGLVFIKNDQRINSVASAFDLQNAQTNAANAAIDRTRVLGIQKKGDEFEANLGRIFGARLRLKSELMELEKVHQGSGVKGAWARDPKTGGLAKNADGKFRVGK